MTNSSTCEEDPSQHHQAKRRRLKLTAPLAASSWAKESSELAETHALVDFLTAHPGVSATRLGAAHRNGETCWCRELSNTEEEESKKLFIEAQVTKDILQKFRFWHETMTSLVLDFTRSWM